MIPVASAVFLCAMAGASSAINSPPDTDERQQRRGQERDTDPHGWYLPDFAKLQTGGFVGTVALGTGYAVFDDVINFGVHYGYTPAAHAGHDVHTLHLTFDIRPIDLRFGSVRWLPFYAGGGLLHVWGNEYFSVVPDRYATVDASYYPPTALHWTAHLGTEIDWLPGAGFVERHGFYYELATIDTFLFGYLENRGTVGLAQAFSSTFGYRVAW